MPKKLLTALTDLGCGNVVIGSILVGFGIIPSAEIMKPRKGILERSKTHLAAESLRLCFLSVSNRVCSLIKCSWTVGANTDVI